jgi:hypothetical protein
MTTITLTALDLGQAPVPGLQVVARAVPLPFHLAGGEVVSRFTATTDDSGAASLSLPPSPTGSHVVVTAGAGRWEIAVPASGTFAVGDPTISYVTGGGTGGTGDIDGGAP